MLEDKSWNKFAGKASGSHRCANKAMSRDLIRGIQRIRGEFQGVLTKVVVIILFFFPFYSDYGNDLFEKNKFEKLDIIDTC